MYSKCLYFPLILAPTLNCSTKQNPETILKAVIVKAHGSCFCCGASLINLTLGEMLTQRISSCIAKVLPSEPNWFLGLTHNSSSVAILLQMDLHQIAEVLWTLARRAIWCWRTFNHKERLWESQLFHKLGLMRYTWILSRWPC